MLESKKPSHLIKKLHSNEVEIKVNFLDETVHTFSVKVSARFVYTSVKEKKIKSIISTYMQFINKFYK